MEAFRDCGWPGFLMLLVGVVGLMVAFVSWLTAALTRGPVAPIATGAIATLLGLLVFAMAPVAVMHGHTLVDEATSGGMISPADAARIREEGYREAGECIPVSVACGVLPLFGGLPAIIIGFRRRGASARGRTAPTS